MTVAITGTGTTIYQNSKSLQQTYPFKTINVLDSAPNGADTVTVTITDLGTGQPTDADGTLGTYGAEFKHSAPGVYTFTSTSSGGARAATDTLRGQYINLSSTPNTAVFTVAVTSSAGGSATDSKTEVVNAIPPANFVVADTTSGNTYASTGSPYAGTLSIGTQYVVQSNNAALSADNLNITAITPNTFIHAGSGNDAIDVSTVGGNNILDGSTGSNFLKGSTSGTDTFFVDDRNATSDIWSTISNFHAGDASTLFGLTTASSVAMVDNQGAAGYTGLTFHITTPGQGEASFTLAGYSQADLSNGRLSMTYGTEADGTRYLYINALK